MRHNAFMILTLWCAVNTIASANNDDPLRTISVSGTVESKIAPDLIVWRISLADTDLDMRKAKAKNDAKIESVLALREKLGVDSQDIETGSVSIRREYERDQRGDRGAFKHFIVNRSVTIRQRDLKRFDEFLDALVASAEMDVHFNFESSRIHDVRAETRLNALKEAKKKAEAMAVAVGAKLGEVITITEDQSSMAMGITNSNAMLSAPPIDLATDRFVPGAMTVQITVYATFELE